VINSAETLLTKSGLINLSREKRETHILAVSLFCFFRYENNCYSKF